MTIVAVMKESDDVLYIGADSQFTDSEGFSFFQPKITISNTKGTVVVWAGVGNPQIGMTEFGAWVKRYQRTESTTWQTLIVEAAQELARLNQIRRTIGAEAGEDISSSAFISHNLCGVLICGWLNNANGAYFVGNKGTFSSIDTVGDFLTIGTGSPFADAVRVTQHYYEERLGLTAERRFQHLMELTSRHANQCSLPFEYVKLTSGEVSRYKSKEPEPGVEETPPASQSETNNSGQ